MSLRSVLREFDNASIQIPTALPKVLRAAAERVERRAEGLEVPEDIEEFDYEQAISRLTSGEATRKDLRRLASGGLGAIEQHDNRDFLIERLLAKVRLAKRGPMRALLVGYLLLPDTVSVTARTVRQFLLRNKDHLPGQWQERVEDFRLLSNDVGAYCASRILEGGQSFAGRFFEDSGLKGVKSSGGVALQIFESLSLEVSKKHSPNILEKYLSFAKSDEGVRFSAHLPQYAKALLFPYVGQQPPDNLKEIIEPFLLEHFGDPRMNPGRWTGVPVDLVGVMKRWLAKASIELLLKVVDESNDTTQWRERHQFWSHYFDLGLVTEAWVALGNDAMLVARRLVREGVLHGASDYGVIDRGGVQADHSVLIFRIQDFVVTEWTHSGKVRIYDAANKHRPKFYQRTYSADLLRRDQHANVYVIHRSNWRSKVAGFLEFELGIPSPRGILTARDTRRCSSCGRAVHALWFDSDMARHCSRCKLNNAYG